MNPEYENAKRQAYSDLAEVNRHLSDEKNRANPQLHNMLMEARRTAIQTLNDINRNDDADYRSTGIGYNTNNDDYARRMLTATMDAINRILPRISENYNETVDRRGGRRRRDSRGRFTSYSDDYNARSYYNTDDDYADDDYSDYTDMDAYNDINDMVMRAEMRAARRSRRMRPGYQGVPNPGTRRDRRLRHNMEMYGDYNDRYGDMDDYTRSDHEQRLDDAYRRGLADATRYNDNTGIYPHIPLMPRNDEKNDTGG